MGANVKNILIGIQSKYTGRHVYLEHFHPDQIENTTPRDHGTLQVEIKLLVNLFFRRWSVIFYNSQSVVEFENVNAVTRRQIERATDSSKAVTTTRRRDMYRYAK